MSKTPEQELINIRGKRDLSVLDLVSVDPLNDADIALIFDVARKFRDYETHKFDLNKNCSMVNVFFENSTRTMSSFDLAGKNLSMDTTSISSSGSSVKKGESYIDTAQTLDSYNVKAMIVRTAESGASEMIARHVKAAVLNAGDGWHEHPTQALLDALTILDHYDVKDMKGKIVTIVGDIRHSRVFGSMVRLFNKLGATIRVAAPQTLLPTHAEKFDIEIFYDVEDALNGAHVVYALRVQEERGANGYIPTLREYSKMYGITRKRLDMAAEGALLMHPGPVRRDVDVHSALVTMDDQSHILRQVENGMAVRKALLWLLCNRNDGKTKQAVKL